MSYNGWTNYQTWVTYTWLTNEENSYRYWDSLGWELLDTSINRNKARIALSDKLQDSLLDGIELPNGLYSDLLGHSVRSIDFWELAEALLPEEESENG